MKIFILGGKSGAELQAGFRVVGEEVGYVCELFAGRIRSVPARYPSSTNAVVYC